MESEAKMKNDQTTAKKSTDESFQSLSDNKRTGVDQSINSRESPVRTGPTHKNLKDYFLSTQDIPNFNDNKSTNNDNSRSSSILKQSEEKGNIIDASLLDNRSDYVR